MTIQWIVFAEDWGRHPSSSQHIIQQMMVHHPVYWVNSIGLRRPSLTLRDIKRLWEKLRQPRRPPLREQCSQPTHIYSLKIWPLAQYLWLKKWNQYQLNILTKLPKHYPRVLWIALPSAVDYIDLLEADFIIYYCGDDFSSLAGVDHKQVTVKEKTLVNQADLILAASPCLAQRFPADKTKTLSHGVDLNCFSPKPGIDVEANVVGFYGSINQWFDQALLGYLAQQLPQYRFELVGPIDCSVAELTKHSNIHFYPALPHAQLPTLLARWQIAILPFKNNRQIQACNPLKLREYLASGTAVISSDFAAARDFMPWLKVAEKPIDWLNHIQQTQPLIKSLPQELIERLQQESWQHKSDQVLHYISENLTHH